MDDLQRVLLSNSTDSNSSYTFKNPCHQNFSFRSPVMKYILTNPTGKAWRKLIMTCKYFYSKNSVYPVKRFENECWWWNADDEKFDPSKTKSATPKLWLIDVFECYYPMGKSDFLSRLIAKIIKCNLRNLRIGNQSITWNDYQILTSSGSIKVITLHYCTIRYSDGTYVTADKLLENLEHVEKFSLTFDFRLKIFKPDTVKKITKILSSFKYMRVFNLHGLYVTFDFSSFMDFLLKNETIAVDLYYVFVYGVQYSDAFKQMLENCFEQLIANPPKKFPHITAPPFGGKNYQEYKTMLSHEIQK